MFEQFEDIEAWQRGRSLSKQIHDITSQDLFEQNFSLVDQIRRAANSIPLNIAEGHNRKSKQEFIRHLYISHGSAGEVQSALYLALDREYISREEFDELYQKTEEVSKMIMGLIKHLRE